MIYFKYFLVLLLFCFSQTATAQKSTDDSLPIIDAHLHATTEHSENIISGLPATLRQVEDHNVVLSVLSGADRSLAHQWKEAGQDQFIIGPAFPCTDGTHPRMYPCFKENNGWPDLEWLRNQYQQGRMSVMGEMLYVYYGISPDDEQLDPYFKLAEELSIPVGSMLPPVRRPADACPAAVPTLTRRWVIRSCLNPSLRSTRTCVSG